MLCNRNLQRMLNRREVSSKTEDDQGSFSEEMTLNMRLCRERGELVQEGKDKRVTSDRRARFKTLSMIESD